MLLITQFYRCKEIEIAPNTVLLVLRIGPTTQSGVVKRVSLNSVVIFREGASALSAPPPPNPTGYATEVM